MYSGVRTTELTSSCGFTQVGSRNVSSNLLSLSPILVTVASSWRKTKARINCNKVLYENETGPAGALLMASIPTLLRQAICLFNRWPLGLVSLWAPPSQKKNLSPALGILNNLMKFQYPNVSSQQEFLRPTDTWQDQVWGPITLTEPAFWSLYVAVIP